MDDRTPLPRHEPDPLDITADQPVREVRGSLRRRVLALVLGFAIVPSMLALVLSYLSASAAIRFSARDQVATLASSISDETDKAVMRRIDVLTAVANDESVARQLRDFAAGVTPGKADVTPYPIKFTASPFGDPRMAFASLYLLGRNGTILGVIQDRQVRPLVTPPRGMASSPILNALASYTPSTPFLGELPELEGGDGAAMMFGVPLRYVREARSRDPYILALVVPMKPLITEIEQASASLSHPPLVFSRRLGPLRRGELSIDFEKEIVAHKDAFFTEKATGGVEGRGEDGRDLYLQFQQPRQLGNLAHPPLPEVRWSVVLPLDMSETVSRLKFALWTLVLVWLVLCAVVGAFGIWFAGHLVEPILKLTGSVQRMAKGDLETPVTIRTGDELENLANSVNDMAVSLKESYTKLGAKLLELDEKARQLELIHAISQSINRSLDMEEMFLRITKEIRDQVPCERLSLGMIQPGRDIVRLDYVFPADRDVLPKGVEVPLEGSLIGKAIRDRLLTLRRIKESGPYYEDRTLYPLGMRIMCIIPLFGTAGPMGTLNLADSDPNRFDRFELDILTRVSESLALAVEHSRLYTRISSFAEELNATVELRTRELRDAQAKLVQTEKFAAAGELAANVAHEINNPLSIIKNYLKIASDQTLRPRSAGNSSEADLTRDSLKIIGEEIDRIARIVAQLRQVNQPAAPENSLVDLTSEIETLIELFEPSLTKHGSRILTDFDTTVGKLYLCRDHLRQIVINLMRNSMDAMEKGGTITVRTRAQGRESVLVSVTDTGSGIPPEHLGRIFDPFFTTKKDGKGTGLGLSVSYGLAKNMGGTLEAESIQGEGTTMRLIIPIIHQPDPGDETPVKRRGSKIIIG